MAVKSATRRDNRAMPTTSQTARVDSGLEASKVIDEAAALRVTSRQALLAVGLIALLVVVPLLIYGQTLGHKLLEWDDPPHVTQNPYLVPLRWSGVAELWRRPYFGLYVPVFYTFLAGETWLAQQLGSATAPYAGVFHAGSMVLHVANVLLVFAILRQLFTRDVPAALAAMLFAVHPLQVESVAWVSETRGLLSSLFGLLSIWLYLAWSEVRTTSVQTNASRKIAAGERGWRWYGGALASFVLALLSKPSAVAIPLVLMILALAVLRRNVRMTLVSLVPWLAIAAALALVTKGQQSGATMTFVTPSWGRPRLAGDALAFYLYKLVWPWSLGADYGRSAKQLAATNWTYFTAAVPVLLAALLLWQRRWPLLIALTIFIAVLLPVLGFVPFAYQDISMVADRYAYLALLGPAVALAWWLSRQISTSRVAAVGAVLALLALMSGTQAGYWRDDGTLFRHALSVNPRSYIAEDKLGMHYYKEGRRQEAVDHFFAAERLNPDFAAAYNNAGSVLIELKRWEMATEQLREAARLVPGDYLIKYNLGHALLMQKRYDEAEQAFAQAARLAPHFAQGRFAYGSQLARRGDKQGALREMDAVLQEDPYHFQALVTKGRILEEQGKLMAAETYLDAALRVEPDNVEVRRAVDQIRARRRSRR